MFVTYKGGNNHKHDCFYADRHVTKTAPAVHHDTPKTAHFDKPAVHNNKPAVHNNAVHNNKPAVHNNAVRHDNGRSNANRHIAQATNNRNGSGHFSGRR